MRVIQSLRRIYLQINQSIMTAYVKSLRSVKCSGSIIVKGKPTIITIGRGDITFGQNVQLNSINYGYHCNMHSPVKLYSEGAEAHIRIGDNTRIEGACIHAVNESITIGDRCLIAANVQIINSSGHSPSFDNPEQRPTSKGDSSSIVIDNDVWLCINSIILPGTKIGRGSIISAGSVVKGIIPPMCIATGNPARVIER